jgi:hypothetical protein
VTLGKAALASLAGVAIVSLAGAARAHDPFEITTDAHVSGDGGGMTVHTTMSLLTAARACLTGPDALHAPAPGDFGRLTPQFRACLRDYYDVRAGGQALRPDGATVSLTVEGDVDGWVRFPRPAHSPLVLDAVGLRKLNPRAGVVLTVTGPRTFLGQKVLRPDDARFEAGITGDAEALGTPPRSSFGRYLALLLAAGCIALFWFVRRLLWR